MDEEFVEALEEGKIIRVSESYARMEGLPIIRKAKPISQEHAPMKRTLEEERKLRDYSRKHSNWKDKQVISELVENFNWQIIQERKKRGMTRRQMAKSIGIEEDQLRLLESGILPTQDFVLINKVQQALNLNLRKDGKDFNKPIKDMFSSDSTSSEIKQGGSGGWREKLADKSKDRAMSRTQSKNQPSQSSTSKDEIEILDDEI